MIRERFGQQREVLLDGPVSQEDWDSKFVKWLVQSGCTLSGRDSAERDEGRAPFVRTADRYRQNGWLGTLPLPPRAKQKPPAGYTGRNAPDPTNDDIAEWKRLQRYRRGNICLHLGPVEVGGSDGAALEVLGLDVDDYVEGGKVKNGGKQLSDLEAELGPLPATWLSTARPDGPSGIRFFLVPAGLAWVGKADKHIDIIQKCHRYAIVWPSFHPGEKDEAGNVVREGGQYTWYLQTARGRVRSGIPRVEELPRLPEEWVDRLTRGGMRDTGCDIDMGPTMDAMIDWARATLPGFAAEEPCLRMRAAVKYWNKQIDQDASSHDKITGAHWELACLAVEGHRGLGVAKASIENHVAKDTIKERGKRTLDELRGEFRRSYVNGLRKLKAQLSPQRGEPPQRVLGEPCGCDLAEEAFVPGGAWEAPQFRLADAGSADKDTDADPLEAEAERAYRRHKANEIARRRLALEGWEAPEDEGDLNHQIANPEPDLGHLVDGLIRARGVVQINAQYKAGKTTLASVNLPKALVTGEPFLQHFKVDFGPDECVGIWNLEVDRQDLVDWLEQIDIPDQHRARVFPLCLRGNRSVDFRNPLAVEWAVNWLREHRVTVWIIDPLSKLYRGEENSSTEFNEWWSVLEDIMRRAGVRVAVIVHHSGHSGEGRARGTSAMMGNPDVLIEYRHAGDHGELPPDSKRYLKAFGRRVNQSEITLNWDAASGELFVDGAGRSRAEDRDLRWGMKAWEAVKLADEPLNQGQLLKAMGLKAKGKNNEPARQGIEYAAREGWIEITQRGAANIHSLGSVGPHDDQFVALGSLGGEE